MSAVLVLRPQPAADATARRLRGEGIEPIIYSLFAVRPTGWQVPEQEKYDALMITSANAVRWAGHALGNLAGLPTFAVGQATADALRERGFTHIEVGKANAQALARAIERAGHKYVLHLCGDRVRSIDPGSLSIRAITVYQATSAGDTEGLLAAVHNNPAIMVHSPRAGARLAELLPLSRRRDLHIIAISRAAADDCGEGWAGVDACETPSDAAMLAIVRRICQI